MMEKDVVFYINGPARLMMSCVIAEELYADYRKHAIILDQFGYDYEALLPHVAGMFERILRISPAIQRYSHAYQMFQTYIASYPEVRKFMLPRATLVLFGIRSPLQKHIMRWSKELGNVVEVYAESLAIDRYFETKHNSKTTQKIARRLFPRAFALQHDYDRFHVIEPKMYENSKRFDKLIKMFDLYGSPAFQRLAGFLTRNIDVSELLDYDTVFLGQPLSNYENFLTSTEEEDILEKIVGNKKTLILPHPNEILKPGKDKYRRLTQSKVFSGGVPSELLLLTLKPSTTVTYSSTAAVNYALMNKNSSNYFFPVHRERYALLRRYQTALPNIVVSEEFVFKTDIYL